MLQSRVFTSVRSFNKVGIFSSAITYIQETKLYINVTTKIIKLLTSCVLVIMHMHWIYEVDLKSMETLVTGIHSDLAITAMKIKSN